MAQRVFGPVRGAGVQITELEGDRPIEPGALGQVGYVGLFEKGDPGKLIQVPTKAAFLKKMGSYIDDGQAPDAAIDFFDVGAGAGGLWAVRVTDGNEVAAEMDLYARRTLLTPIGKLRAKNGGRWGGKEKNFTATVAGLGSFTQVTITTLVAMKVNEWKGGYLELSAVSGKRYEIVGNTAAGVVTVVADATLVTDLGVTTDFRYYLVLENEEKALSVQIRDGEELPDTEFALDIFVDGAQVKTYPNLSTDPTSDRYWVSTINDDDGNDEVFAVDTFTGAHVANVRPANHFGDILTVTAEVLTAVIHDFTINSPVALGNPTFALGTTSDLMLEQKITITMTSATVGTAVSDRFGALGTVTLGTLFNPVTGAGGANINKWVPPFTVTAGGTPLVATDTLVINYKPFKPDALVDGYVYADKPNFPRQKYRIVSNTHRVINVAPGSDMTAVATVGDDFMVYYVEEMRGGRDGNSEIVDADYIQQGFDVSSSPLNQLFGKNLGLVKLACPGVTATAVQKAGVAYAEAKNHQFRQEIPSNVVTEAGADNQVNSVVGRSDYAVVSFPSYGYIAEPTGKAGFKLTTLTGQIHGREAAIAKNFEGYHKAEAGLDATLPKVLKLPTGDVALDEEFLNPLGINVVKKIKGNFVLWGDRTLHIDPAWRFKHQREQMSYYEHVLQENFDFIIFAINDVRTEKIALTALKSFFLPEFTKRALRGRTFEEAAIIKIDGENNTDATRAAGDLFADILLRLADTVERFRIRIGKQGLFEAAG